MLSVRRNKCRSKTRRVTDLLYSLPVQAYPCVRRFSRKLKPIQKKAFPRVCPVERCIAPELCPGSGPEAANHSKQAAKGPPASETDGAQINTYPSQKVINTRKKQTEPWGDAGLAGSRMVSEATAGRDLDAEVSLTGIWGGYSGWSLWQGPEAGTTLARSRHGKRASMAGAEGLWEVGWGGPARPSGSKWIRLLPGHLGKDWAQALSAHLLKEHTGADLRILS